MKKVVIIFVLLALTACAGSHYKIEVESGEKNIYSYPKSAKAGETVRVEVYMVTDADTYFYVDGEELRPTRERYYEFIMPEHDVKIKCVVIANGLA